MLKYNNILQLIVSQRCLLAKPVRHGEGAMVRVGVRVRVGFG